MRRQVCRHTPPFEHAQKSGCSPGPRRVRPTNSLGSCFGRNLDAFSDCLASGFGTPGNDDFAVKWRDHAHSQQALGQAEAARQLEIRLGHCHPTNRPRVAKEPAAARAGEGPTAFEPVG
ncbi:barstar family protein [Streptomyces sp. NPDC090445]|uniref:barstar family protein n=1 Tax=Streptomyces sp. NPDC090445 TaxID=3365963 RepID=UPI0037F24DDC